MFKKIDSKKVYYQIIEQIEIMVIEGKLNKGDKLPTERELCEQMGVGRSSVREAIRILEIIGMIESRRGEGNFIRRSIENNLLLPITAMCIFDKCSFQDIFGIRRALEVEAAALAAKLISDEDLKELYEYLNNMKFSNDEKERAEYDKKFHYKIAEASGNKVLVNILVSISLLIDSFIIEARKKAIVNLNKEIVDNLHEEIYNAIYQHNPKIASSVMENHMKIIENNLLETE